MATGGLAYVWPRMLMSRTHARTRAHMPALPSRTLVPSHHWTSFCQHCMQSSWRGRWCKAGKCKKGARWARVVHVEIPRGALSLASRMRVPRMLPASLSCSCSSSSLIPLLLVPLRSLPPHSPTPFIPLPAPPDGVTLAEPTPPEPPRPAAHPSIPSLSNKLHWLSADPTSLRVKIGTLTRTLSRHV